MLAWELTARLDRAGLTPIPVRLRGGEVGVGPTPPPRRPAAMLALVRRRVAATGLRLTAARAFPVSVGAVAVRVQAGARTLLADPVDDITALLGGPAVMVELTDTDGQALVRVGRAPGLGYVWTNPGPLTSPALPADLTGPTRLTATFQLDAAGRRRPTAVLDCARPGRAAACAALQRDWLRYLPPGAAGCRGPFILPSVRVTGRLRGVPVQRGTGACSGMDARLWARLLGVRLRP